MKFKITKEIVNERLESRGIILVGDYMGTHVKTKFQCVCGHTWMNDPHSIFAGVGCPFCRFSLVTMENINLELERKGNNIRMVTEYRGPDIKTKFKCQEGHIWDAVPRRVLGGTGCPHCKIQKLVLSTKKKIIDELSTRGIELIGPYVDSRTKATFKCSNNHIWESRANAVSCPSCANYGFNPAKSAWSYAFIKENYIKYGITVDLNRRLREHRRNGELILIHSEFHKDGGVAREWENLVKNRFGGRFATNVQCPDGWTETMGIDKLEEFLQFGKI